MSQAEPKSLRGTPESEVLVRSSANARAIVEAANRLVASGEDQIIEIKGKRYVVSKLLLKR